MNLYKFIDAHRASYEIRQLCKALRVNESSYFYWNSVGRAAAEERALEAEALTEAVRAVFATSDGTYGADRVHAQLVRDGWDVSVNTVGRAMANAGLAGISGREHSTTTTRRDRLEAPLPDLLNRDFLARAPDLVWYGDITYIWVETRFWYLATVIDAATKEVLGWALADHMRTELVTTALHRAVARRGVIPTGLIFHSDRGSQYTSTVFALACAKYRIRQSAGRRGCCYDNAAAESFFGIIKRELVNRIKWHTGEQLHQTLYQWIEIWYNRRRLHSTLGYRTPAETYQQHRKTKHAA